MKKSVIGVRNDVKTQIHTKTHYDNIYTARAFECYLSVISQNKAVIKL